MELRRAVIFRIQTRGGSILSWIFVADVKKKFSRLLARFVHALGNVLVQGVESQIRTLLFWHCFADR